MFSTLSDASASFIQQCREQVNIRQTSFWDWNLYGRSSKRVIRDCGMIWALIKFPSRYPSEKNGLYTMAKIRFSNIAISARENCQRVSEADPPQRASEDHRLTQGHLA